MKPIEAILNKFGLEVNERFKLNFYQYEDVVFWFDNDGFLHSVPCLDSDEKIFLVYKFVYMIEKDDIIFLNSNPFKPIEDKEYFYVTTLFDVARGVWCGDAIDKNRYYTNLLFATEEEAYDYREFLCKLYKHCRLFDLEKPNYTYRYDKEYDKITIVRHFTEVIGTPYFDREGIDAFNKKVTDYEIKKYLFYK